MAIIKNEMCISVFLQFNLPVPSKLYFGRNNFIFKKNLRLFLDKLFSYKQEATLKKKKPITITLELIRDSDISSLE